MNERQRIVEFWRAVELLSPRDVRRADPLNGVFDLRRGEPLPWDAGHPVQRRTLRPGFMRNFVVYCGVHRLDDAYRALARRFPPAGESYDARPLGESALLAFVVNEAGRPIFGSEVLSSCAWAIGRLADGVGATEELLTRFDDAQDDFTARFETALASASDDEYAGSLREGSVDVGCVIDGAVLRRLIELTTDFLALGTLFAVGGVRVECREVSASSANSTDHDFLNSFIAEDLRRVSGALGSDACGAAVSRYLDRDADRQTRLDLDAESSRQAICAAVAPRNVPSGRWPERPERMLALSQQFAVNESLRVLGGRAGGFSVNGPPGTGKTTMLRELIAALVVERADRLADLRTATDAFTEKKCWDCGDYRRVTNLWDDRLTGFEIVVACATNAAAENITTEIPGRTEIDSCWGAAADYLSEVATEALAARSASRVDAWGLVAACLGNASNRQKFASAFWFGRPPRDDEIAPPTLRSILENPDSAMQPATWDEAVSAYRAVKQAEREIAAERDAAATRLAALPSLQREQSELAARLAAANDARLRAEATHTNDEQLVATCAAEHNRRLEARREHAEFRPRLLEVLLTFGGAMRRWRDRDDALATPLAEAADRHDGAVRRAAASRELVASAEREAAEYESSWQDARARFDELRTRIEADRAAHRVAYPDDSWWNDIRTRELRAPWIDKEWNRARAGVFLAGLQLHRAFLRFARQQMLENLKGAVDVLTGAAPKDLDEPTARSLWQTLFFVVPVVSTTFASFPRLFSHLSRESLGWVFIDEAGQAAPQQAVGPLWRSRRALVVGDPLQLPPIVTLPFTIESAIRDAFALDRLWATRDSSVQCLSDRGMTVGAYRGSGDSRVWVGAPLNVHRRCDEPMFSISNEIAYQGRMIYGTAERDVSSLPSSRWLDVPTVQSSGHWVPAEGERLDALLDELGRAGTDGSSIIAITPFRDVAHHLRRIRRTCPGLTTGTIHTAQGREATVVVLVLGGAPARPGAKRWAAERPNILNVAVSRARRRLYVIGDHAAWSSHPHFLTLAARLPVSQLTEEVVRPA